MPEKELSLGSMWDALRSGPRWAATPVRGNAGVRLAGASGSLGASGPPAASGAGRFWISL